MIRLTFLLRRRSDMTRAEMQDYWLNQHGPLVTSHARTLDMLRYVQVHTTDDDHERLAGPRAPMEEPYDGAVEVTWESTAALRAATRSDAGREVDRILVEDEHRFIDLERSTVWFNYEYPQVNPTPENIVATERSTVVKLYFPLRHRTDMSLDEAQLYWRTHHGPIIRRQAGASGLMRYQQVHHAEPELGEAMRRSRGCQVEPYTGHAEAWWDRRLTSRAAPETREAAQRAYDDEANFIDFARSTMFLAKEHVLVDRR